MKNKLVTTNSSKLLVYYTRLALTNLEVDYMIQVVEPIRLIPEIIHIPYASSKNQLMFVKKAILKQWKEKLSSLTDTDISFIKDLLKIKSIKLIECVLLSPINKKYGAIYEK